jgi:type IV pilus assembly protein PilY1
MVLGTGSFSFDNDPQDLTAQSLYGVNDTSKDQPEATIVPANLVAYTTTTNKLRTVTATPSPARRAGGALHCPAQVNALLVILPWRRERCSCRPTCPPRVAVAVRPRKQLAVWPQSISGVASLEQARVGSITGTPYGQARPASVSTPAAPHR